MNDDILPFYNEELAFLRKMGAQFADSHPRIAGRLKLNAAGSQDPHVERFLEGVAFMNARLRMKIDDDFPELTDGMLSVLYPHFLQPIPSCSIVQMGLDRSQGELLVGYQLPRDVELESEAVEGETCLFRTCYPVHLWPIQVTSAKLEPRPFNAPATPQSANSMAVIRLELSTLLKHVHFERLPLGKLRLYLYSTQPAIVYRLYEFLLTQTHEVALANSRIDIDPVILPASCLQAVGFERSESLLPQSLRTFAGYRLLSEFFAFPEKFLFIDLVGLTPDRLRKFKDKLEVYIYLNRSQLELEREVTKDTFRLGCTPIVNLFPHQCDPIDLDDARSEHRVVPNIRRESALEIYSIERVTASDPEGKQVEFAPFYSYKHAVDRFSQKTFWHVDRRPTAQEREDLELVPGQEVHLSLIDLGFNPHRLPTWILDVQALCFNRDLPARLPFGPSRPRLALAGAATPVRDLNVLVAPTPTRRPLVKRMGAWRLISQLSLNHFSIHSEAGDAGEALREILHLYNVAGTEYSAAIINSLTQVDSKRSTAKVRGLVGGFCRGVDVKIHFDESRMPGMSAYLFANVLDRFFGMYVAVNSFSRLSATSEQRKSLGDLWQWPARAGERELL